MCLAGKKEQIIFSQQHSKTREDALITFIFINGGIIIHFTTNWSLGAPGFRMVSSVNKEEPPPLVQQYF